VSELFNDLNQNSIIEKSFNKFIDNSNVKLVSFDIFDTLVFRDVSLPSDIFFKLGENEYVKDIFLDASTFKNIRIKAESKARKVSTLEEITLDEIYNQIDILDSQKEVIKQLEIEYEKNSLFVNKQIEKWMISARNKNIKVILVSDMYFSKEVIEKVVIEKLKIKDIEIFISSEIKKTKSKKSLYRYIQKKYSLEYSHWLHVGDNIVSDINNAKGLGINTIHYCIDKNTREQFLIEHGYIKDDLGIVDSIRKITVINNCFEDKNSVFYYNLGATLFGPLLWEFSHWLKEVYEKFNISQICFIMREGKIFKEYFEKLFDNIPCKLIYASRKSTFLASLDEEKFDIKEFNFYNYRDLTLEDFHKIFKIELSELLVAFKHIKIEDANQTYIKGKNLIDLCIENFNLKKEKLKENILNDKSILKEYLEGIGIEKGVLLVDFGGTGTIPMRLNKFLKGYFKFNVLMYMHDIGYYHSLDFRTIPFFSMTNNIKKSLELIRRTPEIFEILLNGIEETTLSYERNDNRIEVKKVFPHNNKEKLDEYCSALYKGVDNFLILSKYYNLDRKINKENLLLLLVRMIDVPTTTEVKYLGDLYHDEGNGSSIVNKLVNEEKISRLREFKLENVYKNFQSDIFYKRNEFHWLQGVITAIDPKFIKGIKGIDTANNNSEALTGILDVLDINPNINKVNIYGAGEFFKELLPHLDERKIEVIKVIDRKAKLSEFDFLDYNVTSLENAINADNFYPIIVTSKVFAVEITDMLFKYGFSNNLRLSVINYYNGLVRVRL